MACRLFGATPLSEPMLCIVDWTLDWEQISGSQNTTILIQEHQFVCKCCLQNCHHLPQHQSVQIYRPMAWTWSQTLSSGMIHRALARDLSQYRAVALGTSANVLGISQRWDATVSSPALRLCSIASLAEILGTTGVSRTSVARASSANIHLCHRILPWLRVYGLCV